MSKEFENNTALVTGANRGIGKAITEALLDAGVRKVYAAVRTLSTAQELTDKYGSRVVPIEFDLTRSETIKVAARTATDVDLVVSNAGVISIADPLADNAVESLKFQMERNVYALIELAQAFGPVLKANGGGAFIQMNSLASIKNFAPFTTYSASKAAAYSVTQGLRDQWLEQGTQVVSVNAGPVETDMSISAGMGQGAPSPKLVAEGILEALGTGSFHVVPDPMAKAAWESYGKYAEANIELQPVGAAS